MPMIGFERSPEVAIIEDFIKELQPVSVMEVGCNWGRELKHLEGLSKLYGLDKSSENIEKAKTYVKGTFKVADASQIPFKNSKFDLVYSSGVLAHTPPEAVKPIINEIFRVAKKYILLVEYVGSRVNRNSVENCKQNAWAHNYDLLVSTLDANVKYNQKMFFGADCFHVVLLRKEYRKMIETVKMVPQERKIELKIGKFKVGF